MKPFFTIDDSEIFPRVRDPIITIEKANRLLEERGKKVFSAFLRDLCPEWCEQPYKNSNYKALLINVEHIENLDTAEKLLNEMVEHISRFRDLECCVEGKWAARVKKLLGLK